jgi:hypothetical protein
VEKQMNGLRITLLFETFIIVVSCVFFEIIFLTKASESVISNPEPPNDASDIPPGNISLSTTVNDSDNDSINITFRTNASGIWNDIETNNSVPNGIYGQFYTFTENNFTYYWSVNCSDGKTWTNQTFHFTTIKVSVVSISIDQLGYDFGSKSANAICYTNTTIINDGTVAVNLRISATNMTNSSGDNWTLSNSSGSDHFVLDCSSDGQTWTHITILETQFSSNLHAGDSIDLKLRLIMPSSISHGHLMGCTIRISATSS